MRALYHDNEDLFKYVSLHSGDNITDIVKLDYVYDTLFIEDANNLTLPEWSKSVFPEGKWKELRDISFTVDTLTDELKRLKGGPWVKEVIQHTELMEAAVNKSSEVRLFMYSGHDTTVAPVLHTLGVFNGLAPPYASMVMLETFQSSGDGNTYLRLSYHNDSNHEPYILTIPGCEAMCSFNKFKQIMKKYVPEDILKECGIDNSGQSSGTMQRVCHKQKILAF